MPDECRPLGGTALAAELGRQRRPSPQGSATIIAALAASGTVACLLRITAFNLREPYAQ
jgi:hypothetical protein